jgi:predicted 3-demethylubiquinone-9 3-methyltransferase (glyoxalase superfamily)
MAATAKIVPNIWFNRNADEAIDFYVSLIPGSRIVGKSHYGKSEHGKEGDTLAIQFALAGQEFVAINGGPEFKPNEGVSFFINCDTQAEIDAFYDKLLKGGEALPCGWLRDRFDVVWQVNWGGLQAVMIGKDKAAAQRTMDALMKMTKVDLKKLKDAAAGK